MSAVQSAPGLPPTAGRFVERDPNLSTRKTTSKSSSGFSKPKAPETDEELAARLLNPDHKDNMTTITVKEQKTKAIFDAFKERERRSKIDASDTKASSRRDLAKSYVGTGGYVETDQGVISRDQARLAEARTLETLQREWESLHLDSATRDSLAKYRKGMEVGKMSTGPGKSAYSTYDPLRPVQEKSIEFRNAVDGFIHGQTKGYSGDYATSGFSKGELSARSKVGVAPGSFKDARGAAPPMPSDILLANRYADMMRKEQSMIVGKTAPISAFSLDHTFGLVSKYGTDVSQTPSGMDAQTLRKWKSQVGFMKSQGHLTKDDFFDKYPVFEHYAHYNAAEADGCATDFTKELKSALDSGHTLILDSSELSRLPGIKDMPKTRKMTPEELEALEIETAMTWGKTVTGKFAAKDAKMLMAQATYIPVSLMPITLKEAKEKELFGMSKSDWSKSDWSVSLQTKDKKTKKVTVTEAMDYTHAMKKYGLLLQAPTRELAEQKWGDELAQTGLGTMGKWCTQMKDYLTNQPSIFADETTLDAHNDMLKTAASDTAAIGRDGRIPGCVDGSSCGMWCGKHATKAPGIVGKSKWSLADVENWHSGHTDFKAHAKTGLLDETYVDRPDKAERRKMHAKSLLAATADATATAKTDASEMADTTAATATTTETKEDYGIPTSLRTGTEQIEQTDYEKAGDLLRSMGIIGGATTGVSGSTVPSALGDSTVPLSISGY